MTGRARTVHEEGGPKWLLSLNTFLQEKAMKNSNLALARPGGFHARPDPLLFL